MPVQINRIIEEMLWGIAGQDVACYSGVEMWLFAANVFFIKASAALAGWRASNVIIAQVDIEQL